VNTSLADGGVLGSSFVAESRTSSTFNMDLNGMEVRCLAVTADDDACCGSDSISNASLSDDYRGSKISASLLSDVWKGTQAAIVHELLGLGWWRA
jgi:hypothetical protein